MLGKEYKACRSALDNGKIKRNERTDRMKDAMIKDWKPNRRSNLGGPKIRWKYILALH